MATFTGHGRNIAGFALGVGVLSLNHLGQRVAVNGTSFAAQYVAGLPSATPSSFLCATDGEQ
jgi:hypothetical protein